MDATFRKKKLRTIQICLFFLGLIVIFFTYKENNLENKKVISTEIHEKIKDRLSKDSTTGDIFYNIQYSGLDISGNRYLLKSVEAYNDKDNQDLVNMKSVDATFYFKDGTSLHVTSSKGKYNNRTLDMIFEDGIEAKYNKKRLNANKAEFSSSSGFLIISDKVKVIDERGTIFADKLFFDIKNQTLNINAFENNKVDADINIK